MCVCVCVCVCVGHASLCAQIHARVSVVVGVVAELDESSIDEMTQCEDRITSQSRALFPVRPCDETADAVDEVDQLYSVLRELRSALDSETQLVVLSPAANIALYFVCKTLPAVVSLRDRWRGGQLSGIVEKLFTFLSCNTYCDGDSRQVRVKRLTWPFTDYDRCLEYFHSMQGVQTVYHKQVPHAGYQV